MSRSKNRGEKRPAGLTAKVRRRLSATQFAFPKERKEPLNDAKHVRNAIARFDQVKSVSDVERDKAWRRIKKDAKKYDVSISESSWHELGRPAEPKKRKKKAKKAKAKKA